MRAVGTDASKISANDQAVAAAVATGSGTSAALAALTAAASQLGADAQNALANQPPACVLGEDAAYRAAMAEYSQSSQDSLSLATEIEAGNEQAAIATLSAATTAASKANADMDKATAAVHAFNNRS